MGSYFVIYITTIYLFGYVSGRLLTLMSQDAETSAAHLKKAAKLVEDIKFDAFHEKATSGDHREIMLTDYPSIVDNFARKFSIPSKVKSSLMDSLYMQDFTEVVKDFKFENDGAGRFVYGRVATMKRDKTINLTYVVYTLDFKLASTVIKDKTTKRILITKERTLSKKVKDNLNDYMTMLAISRLIHCE